jgi:hypothetical protein
MSQPVANAETRVDRAMSQMSQMSQTPLSEGDPAAPLSAEEEAAIRRLLARIGETDPETIAEVIGQCQRDSDVRAYFLRRAEEELIGGT